jgi:hypothetical protein
VTDVTATIVSPKPQALEQRAPGGRGSGGAGAGELNLELDRDTDVSQQHVRSAEERANQIARFLLGLDRRDAHVAHEDRVRSTSRRRIGSVGAFNFRQDGPLARYE